MPSLRAVLVALVVSLAATPVLAQNSGAPANVNDCTLIQDPVELRNCILRFEGNRTPPPQTIETQGQSDGPGIADDLLPSPGAGRGQAQRPVRTRNAPPGQGGSATAPPAGPGEAVRPMPNPRDTETSIEQIKVPPRSR